MTEQEANEKVMKIDLDAVLKSRAGKYNRFIPRFMVSWLKKVICQDDLNLMLSVNAGKTGGDFCRGVIDHLEVNPIFHGEENLPSTPRVTFVSNHPLGGLDGMILIDYVCRRYPGTEPKFIVNDLLTAIEPLNNVFLPVNKHGAQSRKNSRIIDEAFAGDSPMLVFPAGLCSRRGDNGLIADLKWHKMFVKKSIEHNRIVIPVYFRGQNSSFFYNFARLRSLSGMKFNIEMVLLPSEVFKSRGKTFDIFFGTPLSTDALKNGSAEEVAAEIRKLVYGLNPDRHK
ncbi:MAG: 1-acyl-sn-glycerol-3-phosphate acyltransferase [Muribaculaceae bacterium]|nr:1-acyl-sn-glycerol-3-phosphate acyltransferase [Muribaculaceae bacterium]